MLNKEKNYISIILLLTKESRHIETWLQYMLDFSKIYFEHYEFVFVDNNASKALVDSLRALLHNQPITANLVNLPYEVNKEQAMLAGIDASIGDFIYEFEDSMVDYPKDSLWQMYEACLIGHDFVFLQPENYKCSWEHWFYRLVSRYSSKHTLLVKSRVHLISRRAVNRVNQLNKVIHYRKYAYCNTGLNYTFIKYQSSVAKHKKWQLKFSTIDFATDLLLLFTNLGKLIAILFAILFALISILAAIYAMSAYFFLNNIVTGWTTLMLFLSISFTGVFICFAIIIKYLGLLINNRYDNDNIIAEKQKIS
ncbi:MAG: hypothetical protein EP298_05150 [Gammaproteobacteria bacterium]|nr:MAG: hypothetical protein EP298_05150 [Gammaproteobacteria bacterium]UTW42488.1 hypothetical protein KFE69_13605 [bacterium SCSIO 12844]